MESRRLKDRSFPSSSMTSNPKKRKKSKKRYDSNSSSDESDSDFSSRDSSSSEIDDRSRKHKKNKRKMKRKRSRSSSSSSSSSPVRKKKKKKDHKKHKKKKSKKKLKKSKSSERADLPSTTKKNIIDKNPVPKLAASSSGNGPSPRVMKPMTKEEWEKQQSVVRRVYDPETGRNRLVKGDGEILEEIVSKDRHRQINKQATQGDGLFFATKLGINKT